MINLVSLLLLALPLVLAAVAGKWTSRKSYVWLGLVVMICVSVFPLGYWYFLQSLRTIFLNLNYKDEFVAASLTGDLMMIEIPLCLFIFVLARFLWRTKASPAGVQGQ